MEEPQDTYSAAEGDNDKQSLQALVAHTPPYTPAQQTYMCARMHESKRHLYTLVGASGLRVCPPCYLVDYPLPYNPIPKAQQPTSYEHHPEPADLAQIIYHLDTLVGAIKQYTLTNSFTKQIESIRASAPPALFFNLSPAAHLAIQPHVASVLKQYEAMRADFVSHNTRLVVSEVNRHHKSSENQWDYFQEGVLGLIRAIDRFDSTKEYSPATPHKVDGSAYPKKHKPQNAEQAAAKGAASKLVKFSTYGTWWIRQQIYRYHTEHSNAIRIPVHKLDLRTQITKFTAKYNLEHKYNPTVEIIAEELGQSVKAIKQALDLNFTTVSLDQPMSDSMEGGDTTTIADTIADPHAEDPMLLASSNAQYDTLRAMAKSQLTPREYLVISYRHGLENGRRMTLQEIGDQIGLTRERVRQIHEKGITKLRTPSNIIKITRC